MATLHAINCLVSPIQLIRAIVLYREAVKSNKESNDPHAKLGTYYILQYICQFFLKYIVNPILVGLVLYGHDAIGGDWGIKVAMACSIINTSFQFLVSLGTLPAVGTYTNMISKVMEHNLNHIEFIHLLAVRYNAYSTHFI